MLDENAIEVLTDGAMDRDSKQTGGTGFVITFPDSIGVPDIQEALRRNGQTAHRVELIAISENKSIRSKDREGVASVST